MMNDSGVTAIRLRGTNPQLASLLPNLYQLGAQCPTFGTFLDEVVRYLATVRLTVMTLEYNAGVREVTIMVRG
jgi:hypothetical protein